MVINNHLNSKGKITFTIQAQPWPQDLTELPYAGVYHNGALIGLFSRSLHLLTWNPRLRIWVDPINQGAPWRGGGERSVRNIRFPIYDFYPHDDAYDWQQQVQMFVNCFNSIPNHHLIFVAFSHWHSEVPASVKPLLRSIGVPAASLEWRDSPWHIVAGYKGTPEGQAFLNVFNNTMINNVPTALATFTL